MPAYHSFKVSVNFPSIYPVGELLSNWTQFVMAPSELGSDDNEMKLGPMEEKREQQDEAVPGPTGLGRVASKGERA